MAAVQAGGEVCEEGEPAGGSGSLRPRSRAPGWAPGWQVERAEDWGGHLGVCWAPRRGVLLRVVSITHCTLRSHPTRVDLGVPNSPWNRPLLSGTYLLLWFP